MPARKGVPVPMRRIPVPMGQRFGRLVVIGETPGRLIGGRPRRFLSCRCDCGVVVELELSHLKSDTRSCGCLKSEVLSQKARTHGMTESAEWRAWSHMRDRCENPNDARYQNYGARGIRVCDRWQRFENFLADMGPKPSPQHSIDRIDNDAGYSQENCRWATRVEQMNNRQNARRITADGRTLTLAQWSRETGIERSTIALRLKEGWAPGAAVWLPARKGNWWLAALIAQRHSTESN